MFESRENSKVRDAKFAPVSDCPWKGKGCSKKKKNEGEEKGWNKSQKDNLPNEWTSMYENITKHQHPLLSHPQVNKQKKPPREELINMEQKAFLTGRE